MKKPAKSRSARARRPRAGGGTARAPVRPETLARAKARLEREVARRTEDLRQAHRFSESLIDTVQNVVLLLSPEGRILRFNRHLEELSGWSLEEARGRDWFDLFIPRRDRARIRKLFRRAIGIESTRGNVNPILTRDGRELEIEWHDTLLRDGSGRLVGLLCSGRDITRRRRLERELLRISEREQRRIGMDLHDGLGQQITGIAMVNSVLLEKLRSRGLPEAQMAAELAALLQDAAMHLRRIARGLHPVVSDPEGLATALQRLVATGNPKAGEPVCRFECPAPVAVADELAATNLFRIAQEALQNALRHGKAKRVIVRLLRRDGQVVLEIQDDGGGMAPEAPDHDGLGLRSMRFRAETMSGVLEILRSPGGGTLVRCLVPEPCHSRATRREGT